MSVDWATFGVDLHLDLDPATSRRSGLEHALRDAIRSGRLAPEARLPSTRALADELRLSRGTVSAAYDQLVAEGYLAARRGSGTTVAGLPPAPGSARRDRAVTAQPRYDLRPGSPDVTMFPTAAWLRACRRALAAAPARAFGYGDPRGRRELRTALAGYLGRVRGVLASPDQIVVTSGFVQALSLVAGLVGARIAMEDPGLPFHRDVVRRAGARVVPLPVDELGARTDLLPDLAGVRAAVLTPAHQYPMGMGLHPRRRQAATSWAATHHGLVIEDDYDSEFRYDRQPVGAIQGTAPDHVAYIGTASKTLAPAVRLAWLVLPPRLVEPVVEAKLHADLHTETIGQLTLADLIETHAYDRHVRSCRLRYRRRRDLLVDRLAVHHRLHGVAAGLHAVVSLPEGGPSEADVLSLASSQGLALEGMASHWHQPGDHPPGVVVGYGTPPAHAYAAALDTLTRVLRGRRR